MSATKMEIQRAVREALASNLETLQALAGERGTPAMKAVRKGDVPRIGAITLTSARVTAAPTMDDHNKVVEDIKTLAALIEKLGAAFSG
jgi:hypothetical protein